MIMDWVMTFLGFMYPVPNGGKNPNEEVDFFLGKGFFY